jgi:hypothetical protein
MTHMQQDLDGKKVDWLPKVTDEESLSGSEIMLDPLKRGSDSSTS